MKKLLVSMLVGLCTTNILAQSEEVSPWTIGISSGFHSTQMKFSDINEKTFPSSQSLGSGVYSIWLRRTFFQNGQFAIRPGLSFLKRGGTLDKIYSKKDNYYKQNNTKDIQYRLNANYVDMRVPVMYRFGKQSSVVRPFVYVAPILGFALGGSIEVEDQYYDTKVFGQDNNDSYAFDGMHLDATTANLSSIYLAGSVGIGLELEFDQVSVSLEAAYEYGLTNTYGDDDNANHKLGFPSSNNAVKGKRDFRGFEISLNFGIPFDAFHKKKTCVPIESIDYMPQPVISQPQEVKPVKQHPCYTLEEIIDMLDQGESVEGKTICAIDDAINFDYGKSIINKSSYNYLDKLALTLKRTNARIHVKGHTDNRGTENFNMKLSKDRAENVVNYLVKKGVPRNILTYSYYGMSRPLTTNDTEEGRSLNRRVEFEIMK